MKILIRMLGLWSLTLGMAIGGELKIATVDLHHLSDQYFRAQEISKELKQREANLFRELEGLRLQGMQLAKEADELRSASQEPALNAGEREVKKRALELRLADLQGFQVRYEDTRAQRVAELQNQAATAKKRLMAEIVAATRRIADAEGCNLVLNYDRSTPERGEVLHAKGVRDLTDAVLADLNLAKANVGEPPPARK